MATKTYQVVKDGIYLRTNTGLTQFGVSDEVELELAAAKSLIDRGWVKAKEVKKARKAGKKEEPKPIDDAPVDSE